MNKLKFLTITIISTLFFSTLTTNAMKNRNFSSHNLKNINSSYDIPKLKQSKTKRTSTYENRNKKINLNKNKTEIFPNSNTINNSVEKNTNNNENKSSINYNNIKPKFYIKNLKNCNEIKNLNNINTKKDINNIINNFDKEKSQNKYKNKIKISENMKNKIKILDNLFKEKKDIEKFVETLKTLNFNLNHIIEIANVNSVENCPTRNDFYEPDGNAKLKFMVWNSKNIISEIINNAINKKIENNDTIINNFNSIFNSYKSNIDRSINATERKKFKNEYINKCKQKIKEIKDAILYDLRENNSYKGVTNFLEFSDDENCFVNLLDKYIENIKKNKQEYENYIEKSKWIKKLKEEFPKILKKEINYLISEKTPDQLEDPLKEEKKIDHDLKNISGYIYEFKNILNNCKNFPMKIYFTEDENIKKMCIKEKETLDNLIKSVEKLEEKSKILANKENIDISPKEMLDYYDEIIDFTDKIRPYLYIVAEIRTNENYMLNVQSNHSLYLNKIIKNKFEENNIYVPEEAFK